MKMMEVGRLCVKIAGRDAGKKCVVVDVTDDKFVMIDGSTRRRKCNIAHLEPLKETIDIKKGASHAEVAKAFSKLGIEVWESKPRKATKRPQQIRIAQKKIATAEEKKPAKQEKKEAQIEKTEKKEEKKEAKTPAKK
ncbi:MAG: 50S ribosomal protein L14e [Nanoarchaeota archaeon]|nr:50S ribosomal protein L14e [Nanoarchaeota archaeon]